MTRCIGGAAGWGERHRGHAAIEKRVDLSRQHAVLVEEGPGRGKGERVRRLLLGDVHLGEAESLEQRWVALELAAGVELT